LFRIEDDNVRLEASREIGPLFSARCRDDPDAMPFEDRTQNFSVFFRLIDNQNARLAIHRNTLRGCRTGLQPVVQLIKQMILQKRFFS
jgi:hypothetical protein